MSTRPPFSTGSVSLRLYPHAELEPNQILDRLLAQGRSAAVAGFDGVMTSEHHGGFGGYLPNPIQTAGWLLEAMPTGWAAPCPLLLLLRPTALVVEEVAWLAVRFPGRVGVGVAAGSLDDDFAIMDQTKERLVERFGQGLATLSAALGGVDPGRLAGDSAVARCRDHPVPVLSAAMSAAAVRRAARAGAGLLIESLSTPDRVRHLVNLYREAGGLGPVLLIRRAWVGPAPVLRFEHQLGVYREYADVGAQAHWGGDELVTADSAEEVAERLGTLLAASGADALNLRVHSPGVGPDMVDAQIDRLGQVVKLLHGELPVSESEASP
jgi:alkanesulfonate monooxygenase SsuD/methylene tetrahydromethanopterin reductase-like flavin-dependent oxidoreductase (luciferase family)